MGPALGSAGSLETLVAAGEARVKRQGDVAVDNLFTEEKHATERLDEKTLAHEEKISKNLAKEFDKQKHLMEIQVQRALENRGLESLLDIDKVIKAQCMVEVPKVVSHIQNIISENPGTLLTGKVMGDIFARVEEKSAIFGRDMQASFEELKIELRTEVGDVRKDLKGGYRSNKFWNKK